MTVDPQDTVGSERLARYLLRPPLSLERMARTPEGTVLYRRKASDRFGRAETPFAPLDFLARLLMHMPPPRLHTVRYYGHYSSVARARRRGDQSHEPPGFASTADLPTPAERRRLRRTWAQMIRRIYKVDPLTCRCGAKMRILSGPPRRSFSTLGSSPRSLQHLATQKTPRHRAAARQRAPPASAGAF